MPRIDAWDVQPQGGQDVIDAGFPRGFEEAYDVGTQLGSGGFGVVRVVRERATGTELAAKTIPKRLNVPNISAAKQAQHLENVKREVEVGTPRCSAGSASPSLLWPCHCYAASRHPSDASTAVRLRCGH